MVPELIAYMQRLELLAFFAGYPLLFTLAYLGAKIFPSRRTTDVFSLAPAAYALTATLFIVRQVFYASDPFTLSILALKIWAYIAILFWLPNLRKRRFLSLLHSFVFFGLIVFDIATGFLTPSGRDQIANDMKILTDSLLLNTASLAVTAGALFFGRRIRRSFNR
jgi:hypothetical protein